MELKTVRLEIPEEGNLILGHAHFIKTVEDLHEIMVTISSQVRFGIAFCEASGPCLIRISGNEPALQETASRNAQALAAGHTFVIAMRQAFPINFLNAIKQCAEVCTIHCATANPIEVIVAETEQGKGILGVIDGFSAQGIEGKAATLERQVFLRQIGYKLGAQPEK